MAVFVTGGPSRGSKVDDVTHGNRRNGTALGCHTRRTNACRFRCIPLSGEVETVVADSRPAFSNMRGERGIGSQQELVGEAPEDVVIGVDDDKLGRSPRSASPRSTHLTRKRATAPRLKRRSLGQSVTRSILSRFRLVWSRPRIEKRHLEVGQQEFFERTAPGANSRR